MLENTFVLLDNLSCTAVLYIGTKYYRMILKAKFILNVALFMIIFQHSTILSSSRKKVVGTF